MSDSTTPPPDDVILVDRQALARTVKLLTLAHQKGLFVMFPPVEAMKHLSLVVHLESLLTQPKPQ